jgi:hypothetical protein
MIETFFWNKIEYFVPAAQTDQSVDQFHVQLCGYLNPYVPLLIMYAALGEEIDASNDRMHSQDCRDFQEVIAH